ncbi:hypothetical protein [Anaerobutyricum hallii]|nr:hypothetical protein [Anaerobutyricum hallii]
MRKEKNTYFVKIKQKKRKEKNTYFVKIKQKKTGKILQYVLQLFP